MLRWTSPPSCLRTWRSPSSCCPFRAVMLSPSRVGDPASARALARPYRDVAERLTQWIDRGDARADRAPALYLHEYTAAGLTVRGLVGALRMSRACRHAGRPRGLAARGDPPRAGRGAGRADAADGPQPRTHPPGAPRQPGAPRPRRRGRAPPSRTGATSTAPDSASGSGPCGTSGRSPASGTSSPAASASSPTATTGTPPTCDSRRSTRAPRGTPGSRCWSTRPTLPCSSAPSTGRCRPCASTCSSRRHVRPAPR